MNRLFKSLEKYDIGLLITIDEIRVTLDEMIAFASTYQLFVREGKRVDCSWRAFSSRCQRCCGTSPFLSCAAASSIIYRELFEQDVQFLEAMLPDSGDVSSISNVAKRMGVSSNYASKYRARLIEQGVIGERGAVGLAMICRSLGSS